MTRILIVAYRPHPGKLAEILALLREQHMLVRRLGFMGHREPWLMQSAAGEVVYIASFEDPSRVEACWEHPEFQDIDAQLSAVSEMVPIRDLQESGASYIDMAALRVEPVPALPSHTSVTLRQGSESA